MAKKAYTQEQLAAAIHVVKNFNKTHGADASSTGDAVKTSVHLSLKIINWFNVNKTTKSK